MSQHHHARRLSVGVSGWAGWKETPSAWQAKRNVSESATWTPPSPRRSHPFCLCFDEA